jgi:cell division septation protein DedD
MSVVVFFLGILVGQGIEERKLLKKEEPLAKIPVQPLPRESASGSQASAKEEITFYDTLTKGSPGTAPAKESKAVESAEKLSLKDTKADPQAETPKPVERVKETARAAAQEKAWAVQVNAYRQEKDAAGLAKKLKDKGYDAYVVSSRVKGRTWYRVRVGRLGTEEQAGELREALKTKESFTKAITVRQ